MTQMKSVLHDLSLFFAFFSVCLITHIAVDQALGITLQFLANRESV